MMISWMQLERRSMAVIDVFKKLLPFVIVISVWVLPINLVIRVAITLIIGLDLQRTYIPMDKEDKEDDKNEVEGEDKKE